MASKIGQRWADNDWEAFKIATTIEANGGNVFSVCYNGEKQLWGAKQPISRYIVWFKIPAEMDFDEIHKAITLGLEG